MVMPKISYSAPKNLNAAIQIMKENDGARLLAGGQSLLVDLKRGRISADLLVDMQHIPDLPGIRLKDDGLQVGALTSLTQLSASEEIRKHYTALAESAESVGDLQTRNLSTLGGGLACNDPAGDLAAAVLVLDGVIQVTGQGGKRSIPASEFFIGTYKTALMPTEVITSIFFPAPEADESSTYEKFKNPANGYALCGFAARIVRTKDGYDYKLAVTGALEYPCLLSQFQEMLANKAPTAENVNAALSRLELPLAARHDLYASGDYRTHLVKVLATRAIRRAADQPGSSSNSSL
jgi:aerobic carbon-monoxide dehydrogenase medium subunit